MKRKKLMELPVMPRKMAVTEGYEAAVHPENVAGEEVLVIELYYRKNTEATYRIFLGQEDYETCCRTGSDPVWSHKDIDDLIGYEWKGWGYRLRHKINFSAEGRKRIETFTGYQAKTPSGSICRYQENLRKKKIQEKERKVTDAWDREIGELPDLPADFGEFCRREAVRVHYFFFRKEEKGVRGYCQYCKAEQRYPKLRHRSWGTCPSCGKRVRSIDMARRSSWRNQRNVWILQAQGDRLVYREYQVTKWYERIPAESPEQIQIKETESVIPKKLILIGNRKKGFQWDRYKQKGECRWVESSYLSYDGCMYHRNAREWKEALGAKYLPLEQLPTELDVCLDALLDSPFLDEAEKLMKIGLWQMGIRALRGKYPGKTPKEMLKTENDDLKILLEAGADEEQYRFFMKLKEAGKRPTAKELGQYWECDIPLYMIENLIPYTTWHQIYKRYRYNSAELLNEYYRDYFNMCKELKFDMKAQFVLFPKNIKKAHDDLVLYYNEKKAETMMQTRNSIYAKVEEKEKELNARYGMEDETYFIRAPHEAAELIKEGHAMHHCVGGESYAKKMAAGESYILFIRKKEEPEKSWYTMEVGSDNHVIQVRGFANGDPDHIRQTGIYQLFEKRLKELQKEKEE